MATVINLRNREEKTELIGTETRTISLTVLNGPGLGDIGNPDWAWWAGAFGNAARIRCAAAEGDAHAASATVTRYYFRNVYTRFRVGNDQYVAEPEPAETYIRNPNPTTGEGDVVGGHTRAGNPLIGAWTQWSEGSPGGYGYIDAWATGASPTLSETAGIVPNAVGGENTNAVIDGVSFRTPTAPLRNGSFSVAGSFVDGTTFNATANNDGLFASGSAPVNEATPGTFGVFGGIDYQTGVFHLRFGRRVHAAMASEPGVTDMSYLGGSIQYVQAVGVQADSLRFNATAFVYLPLDADILGIDPVRLPSDGRVPIFRSGSFAVVGNTATHGPVTVSDDETIDLGRVRLSRVRVLDSNGAVIHSGYTADLETGEVTFTDVSDYAQPVTIEHRIEDMVLVSEAQINGQLTFTRPLTHDYPAEGSYVSSALIAGDMRARVSLLFDQQTWNGTWSDSLQGSAATATFNDALYPIGVTNEGAITERWYIQFTNTTNFNVIGEHVGVIATGNTSQDCAPINPATGAPYFTIPALGWGMGWATGNVVRFNTVGALYPVWAVRTVQQGPETVEDDSFTLLSRGDVDRP